MLDPKAFAQMGEYILQGMNEQEAGLLAGISASMLEVAKKKSPEYNAFVQRKRLEFKSRHLGILAGKNDPRVSQWLLERLSPEEFSTSKSKEPPSDSLAGLIRDIQRTEKKTIITYVPNSRAQRAQRSSRDADSDIELVGRLRSILS